MHINEFNQPIGESLPGHTPGESPSAALLSGRYCRLEKLSAARHGAGISSQAAASMPMCLSLAGVSNCSFACFILFPLYFGNLILKRRGYLKIR